MEDLSNYPGLWRRKNNYEIRKRVPKDLVDVIGKKEITKALGTDSFTEAVLRYHVEMNNLTTLFDAERARLKNKADNPDLLSTYSDHQLKRMAISWLDDYQRKRSEYNPDKTYKGFKTGETITDQELVGELKSDINHLKDEIGGNTPDDDIHEGATNASKYLEDRSITFDSTSNNFRTLAHYFSKALLEYHQRLLQKTNNKPFQAFDPMFANTGSTVAVNSDVTDKRTIQQVIDEHLENPSKPVSKSTKNNYAVVIRLLNEYIGLDRFVHTITRDQCKAMRDMLLALPKNLKQKAPNKTIIEGVELGKKNNWDVINATTVNSYISKLSALLGYAEQEGYIQSNPCKKLLVQDTVKDEDKRNPFSIKQLQIIFHAPLYTGCTNDRNGYNKIGDNHPRRSRFWVPLIGLWTGMRLAEICNLEVADIIVQNGVSMISVNENGGDKHVKTKNAIRHIPVHPELERIGFLDYAYQLKVLGEQSLFPDLGATDKLNKSKIMSKRFATFLGVIGAKTDKTNFHSFRHSYRDALREAEIPTDAARQLGGWSNSSTDENYGSGLKPETLYKHICKIGYDDLDLSHLYLENAKDGQNNGKVTI